MTGMVIFCTLFSLAVSAAFHFTDPDRKHSGLGHIGYIKDMWGSYAWGFALWFLIGLGPYWVILMVIAT